LLSCAVRGELLMGALTGTSQSLIIFTALARLMNNIPAGVWFERQYRITFNVFRKGTMNFFGIFYTYVIQDTNSQDNEDRAGSVGIKVLF